MKTIEVKMQLPELPEGWEYTGEYRGIRNGDFYFSLLDGGVELCATAGGSVEGWPIVRRVPTWRPATLNDLNKNLKARFSDDDEDAPRHWMTSRLCGWVKLTAGDDTNWADADGTGWQYCEVLEQIKT